MTPITALTQLKELRDEAAKHLDNRKAKGVHGWSRNAMRIIEQTYGMDITAVLSEKHETQLVPEMAKAKAILETL
jgi:hypothetical protein